VHSSPLA